MITFATRKRKYKFKMKFIAVIPARYASTRFPGKPLAVLGGKTVIQRVYEQAVSVLPEAYVAISASTFRATNPSSSPRRLRRSCTSLTTLPRR